MQGSLFVGIVVHKGSELITFPKRLPKLPVKAGLILAAMLLANLLGTEAKQLLTSPVDINHPAIAAASGPQGKVVRVHSSTATNWDFSSIKYWEYIDQAQVQKMLDRGVLELTGETSLPSAWGSIITGYNPGDTIAIKVNNNNARFDANGELNTNHQVVIAVIAGLRSMGVPEADIYVYDVSRQVIPRQRDGVLNIYPNVNVVHNGNVTWDSEPFTGSFGSVSLPTALTNAEHLINIHLFKLHTLASFTGALKNHFGSTSNPRAFHYDIMNAIAELNDNPNFRDKTRLAVGEALFGAFSPLGPPAKFSNMDLFPEETPNSLFLSADPVAMDSVMYDFFYFERDGDVNSDAFLHASASIGLGVHEHGTLIDGTYSPKDLSYETIDYISLSLDQPFPTFADVPFDHWAHDYIEALYQAGYTAGCSTDPLMYCPENTMNRAESAVFVERGIHNADYMPNQPTTPVFDDVPLSEWFAKWAHGLWNDGYTAGCGTDPLIFCPLRGHSRTEGTVFYLRMLSGTDYVPPDPVGIFADVEIDFWGAKWIEAAYNAGLIPACETSPELNFCPDDPLDRAMAAYMMVQAKGLPLP